MLAFSSCWNAHRHTDGEHLINEVLLLGFDAVEFSHGFGEALFPGFRKGFDQGRLRVSGAKYPCPAHCGNAVGRPLNLDEARSSVDRVAEYQGRYLIVTFGDGAGYPARDSGPPDSDTLVAMIGSGEIHSRRYVKEKLALIERREAEGPVQMQRLRELLVELLPHAESCGVRIAVENRALFEQFPTAREIEALLAEFDSPWLGYWHDFGHAERQAQLGFLGHREQLERLGNRLVGCHVHDLVWPDQDHAVPGQGIVRFDQLIPMLPKDASVVWEIEPRRKTADIKAALKTWRQTFP